jgi:hypothetical protein
MIIQGPWSAGLEAGKGPIEREIGSLISDPRFAVLFVRPTDSVYSSKYQDKHLYKIKVKLINE